MIIDSDKITLLEAESETNRVCLLLIVVDPSVTVILSSKGQGIFFIFFALLPEYDNSTLISAVT